MLMNVSLNDIKNSGLDYFKNISQDDFYVLLIEGFTLGITAGIIILTGFSHTFYFPTPFFEYFLVVMIILGSLVLLSDALTQMKDNPKTKLIIYIFGFVLGNFILILNIR